MDKSYMVYYYVVQNGVERKGCILIHGCNGRLDACKQARIVLGKEVYIVDVRRQ